MGWLIEDESDPKSGITPLELENHSGEESHEFTVQIEDEEVVFEGSPRLGPAGSGNAAVAFEDSVEWVTYTVRIHADEYSVTAEIGDLISDDKTRLSLQFYHSDETLHMEHRLYDQRE